MKTEVEFQSNAFNCTEPKDYFINECCFGDDVCRWLIGELRARGLVTADEPGQEDFGWYFTFTVDAIAHCFVVGFQPNDPSTGDRWLGWLERQAGFFASLLGARHHGVSQKAVDAFDQILRAAPEIRRVMWHERGTDSERGSAEES